MIGFIGPDGSGKTTITQKLAERVNYSLNNIFPSIIYYHGRFGVLPEVKQAYNAVASRLKLPIKRRLTIEESTQLLDSSPHSPIRTAVYLLYYIIDYLIGHFILAKHRSRGEILTFDRYVYDFLIHKTYGRIPLRLRRFIADLAPQPNLLIFLEGSPNTIHQRKPELRVDQIIEQQAMCKKIITKNENFGVTCSVNGSAQVTLECVFLHMISTLEAQSLNKLRDFLSDD